MSISKLNQHTSNHRLADDVEARLHAVGQSIPEFSNDPDLLDAFRQAIGRAPEPLRVTAQFERFLEKTNDQETLRAFCLEDPRRLDSLLTLLAGSAFLCEILIRDPDFFRQWSMDRNDARRRKREMERTAVEMDKAIIKTLSVIEGYEARKLALRRFHRHELFRIAASDILGLWDMPAVTQQLSILADALIRAALEIAAEKTNVVPAGLAIVGMGKLGGSELNYSSDIDLIFIAGSDAAKYSALGAATIDVLGGVTSEGFLYRVDMRLRPWGRAGALVHTVDAFLGYLENHGEHWERQALLKARVLAGNMVVGQEFMAGISSLIGSPREGTREAVHKMKMRIETELAKKGKLWGDVKQGQGSIRDVEFIVQFLQLTHGNQYPSIHTQNTVKGLAALQQHELLSADDYRSLSDGYAFLRVVEHHLQLHHNRQTHAIPRDPLQSTLLARRLAFHGDEPGKQLVALYEQHARAIRRVFDRIIGGVDDNQSALNEDVNPHITRMAPSYSETFSPSEISEHAAMTKRLTAEHPLQFSVEKSSDGLTRITIVSYDYLGMLSVITGLLQASGFDIVDGHIFTYEPLSPPTEESEHASDHQRIVDVFTVRPLEETTATHSWKEYERVLRRMIRDLGRGRRDDVQGELAERVVAATPQSAERGQLYPVDIGIDNETDSHYTVLRIEAPDTVGFLYELTNALSMLDIDIARVDVRSVGERVHDTLYVTDKYDQRLTDLDDQTRVRVATVLVQHFIHLLPIAPNPTAALKKFRLLLSDLFRRDDWADEISSLEQPEVLDTLARLLGVSDFLWADFLRMQHKNILPLVEDVAGLTTYYSKKEMALQLDAALEDVPDVDERIAALNQFKNRSLFRIDMRYVLGRIAAFEEFSAELSDLAEVIVEKALNESLEHEKRIYGNPTFEGGGICPISVCALGKFGGRELGFASDIELLFVYEANGKTDGQQSITNAEFFDGVARRFISMIKSKRDGIFEIDLRLRPYGQAGSLTVSIAAFQRYYALDGPAWPYERQLLLKLRPIAGDQTLSNHLLEIRGDILSGLVLFDVSAMRAMRERQLRHIVRPGLINAKYSPGGLVDIEYLVQGLQISYCNRYPELLEDRNTRSTLGRLHEYGLVSDAEFVALDQALIFIRRIIDGLRMVRGNARDLTLPTEQTQELLYLARRLGHEDTRALLPELADHMGAVESINSKLLA